MAEINEKLNIPDKIKVGFQERGDTYTGKLSYVTYINKKGKLAKEISWEGWRDKKITPLELDNVPTEGFVLNKKAGGYSTGWNHRQTYCRVYDPRDFEFEISIENLLYILQECTSSKGKGLEGKFVYAWSGKDLVLLPVDSLDYKMSKQLIDSTEKITMKSLKIGASYKGKVPNSEDISNNLVYIGKMTWYGFVGGRAKYNYYQKEEYKFELTSKTVPTFVDIDKKQFHGFSSLSSLYHLVDENILSLSDVEDYKEKFLHTFHGSANEIEKSFIKRGDKHNYSDSCLSYGHYVLDKTDNGDIVSVGIEIRYMLNNRFWDKMSYFERKEYADKGKSFEDFKKESVKVYRLYAFKTESFKNNNKTYEYAYAIRNHDDEYNISEEKKKKLLEDIKYKTQHWVKTKNGDEFPMQYDYRKFTLFEFFK